MTVSFYNIVPVENYIDSTLLCSQSSFVEKQIFSRGLHALLIPGSIITAALDIIIGIGAMSLTFITFGCNRWIFTVTCKHLSNGAKDLLTLPYKNFLQTINPNAPFTKNNPYKVIERQGYGFTSKKILNLLSSTAETKNNSHIGLENIISTRLIYLLYGVSSVVTRIIDAIISIPATILSFATLGKFVVLNDLSYRTLHSPLIVADIFFCAIKFINPSAGYAW